jgi:TonB family protein
MKKLYIIALLLPLLTFSQAKNASSSFSTTTIAASSLFSTLANQAWPYKIDITSPSDVNNRAAQTLTINITSLPLQGANYRVVKSVANGNLYYGPGKALSLGFNSIRVNAVSFDRSIAIQFTSGDVTFDQLARNGSQTYFPFTFAPIFPGCEEFYDSEKEKRKCFQEKLQQHIADNFQYPKVAHREGIQGRVYVQFIIDIDGSIKGIRTRGSHRLLEKEANRIISLLPGIVPGRNGDEFVRVPFSVPITFRLTPK